MSKNTSEMKRVIIKNQFRVWLGTDNVREQGKTERKIDGEGGSKTPKKMEQKPITTYRS